MRFVFCDKALEQLYIAGTGAEKLPEQVVDMFARRVRHIEVAKDERDLRQPKSVHFEQLKEKAYRGKSSLRLNRQWRLIISIEEDKEGKYVNIYEINNHYGD